MILAAFRFDRLLAHVDGPQSDIRPPQSETRTWSIWYLEQVRPSLLRWSD
jgi:hypothetical protein